MFACLKMMYPQNDKKSVFMGSRNQNSICYTMMVGRIFVSFFSLTLHIADEKKAQNSSHNSY